MAARGGDPWLAEFAEARVLSDDAFILIQERRSQQAAAADASVARLAAASRRKLTALGSKITALEAALPGSGLSESETNRRRDMILRLRTQATQLAELLTRKDAVADRCGAAQRGAARRGARARR
jgi:hypothetical protein